MKETRTRNKMNCEEVLAPKTAIRMTLVQDSTLISILTFISWK